MIEMHAPFQADTYIARFMASPQLGSFNVRESRGKKKELSYIRAKK